MAKASAFTRLKLRAALATISAAYTWQEGLFNAYVEHLQWLEDVEDELSRPVRELLADLTSEAGPDRVERARATAASLSAAAAVELIERLSHLTLEIDADTRSVLQRL